MTKVQYALAVRAAKAAAARDPHAAVQHYVRDTCPRCAEHTSGLCWFCQIINEWVVKGGK